ncbi:MAG: cation diffusion facilitator family transporter [Chitinispirillaceae bacterium]|jgi:cation diffusion facilitator family transporter
MKKTNVPIISITSNSVLLIFKIVAGVLMGSVAVISEAVHSGIDLLASAVAFASIRKAEQPADQDHPFGHGKFENISGFFEALLIFFAAGLIIFEAIKKLLYPILIEKLGWGIGVMAVSTIVNIFVSQILFKSAKKHGSIAIEADAMHLWTDVFTSGGVMAGLVIIRLTHWEVLDPVIAILVAGLILKASFDLTIKAIADLADHQLPENELSAIRSVVDGYPEVDGYHKLRTRKSGSRREIDLHIQIDKNTTLATSHDLCFRIENAIKTELPGAYVTIHVEPSREEKKV